MMIPFASQSVAGWREFHAFWPAGRRFTAVWRVLLIATLLGCGGCTAIKGPTGKHSKASPTQPEARKENRAELNTGLIKLVKTVPAEVRPGEEFGYEIKITALAAAGNVEVEDQLADGASHIRSEPSAEVKDRDLVWKFRLLNAGDSRTIKVWIKSDREGAMLAGAAVRADRRAAPSVFVGKPALAISIDGPEVAAVDTEVAYLVSISNRGNVVAKNVVITNELPAGLTRMHRELDTRFQVGDLAPGESHNFPLILQAAERAKLCAKVTATAVTRDQASDEACTTFAATGYKLAITGPPEAVVGQPVQYQITLFNSGDTKLTGIVLTENSPNSPIINAPGATVNGPKATWNIGDLNAGAERRLEITLTATQPGPAAVVAEATTSQGLRQSAQTSTAWK